MMSGHGFLRRSGTGWVFVRFFPPNVITLQKQIDRSDMVISDGMPELDSHLASYMKEEEVLEDIIYPPISRSITVAVSFVMELIGHTRSRACMPAYWHMIGCKVFKG